MAERDLTAREDRFIGLCLVAAAVIVVFFYVGPIHNFNKDFSDLTGTNP